MFEKGALIDIWSLSFCGYHPEDTSFDSLAVVVSEACVQIQWDSSKQIVPNTLLTHINVFCYPNIIKWRCSNTFSEGDTINVTM